MEVIISPSAVTYILKKGGHAVLFLGSASGCCSIGGVPLPMVELGLPRRDEKDYETRQVDGVTIHLAREVKRLSGRVEIDSNRGLWSPYLSVNSINT